MRYITKIITTTGKEFTVEHDSGVTTEFDINVRESYFRFGYQGTQIKSSDVLFIETKENKS